MYLQAVDGMGITALDEELMRRTFVLARATMVEGNHPFAAILTLNGEIVCEAQDQTVHLHDPTYHPELAVIQKYCRQKGVFHLPGYCLYTNVEPCPMCAGAIYYATVSRVVYSVSRSALYDVRNRARGHKNRTYKSCRQIIEDSSSKIEVVGEVLLEEGKKILDNYPFPHRAELRRAYLEKSKKRVPVK